MKYLQDVNMWVWVAAAVVVVLVVVGLLATLGKRKKRDWDHFRAEAMRSEVAKYTRGEVVELPMPALIASGVKP